MRASGISAVEYLTAQDKAGSDARSIADFKRLRDQIDQLPQTRTRLALEFLEMASASVRRGQKAERFAFQGLIFAVSQPAIEAGRVLASIRALILVVFEALAVSHNEDYTQTLSSALEALRCLDHEQFLAVISDLKMRLAGYTEDFRLGILLRAEEPVDQRASQLRQLRKAAEQQTIQRERRVRSWSS